MSNEITVLYPTYRKVTEKKGKERVLAARYELAELVPKKLDLSQLTNELTPVLQMLDKMDAVSEKYGIDETKVSVSMTIDSSGKIRVALSAKILQLLSGEVSGEVGRATSENQLFEITIRRKARPSS